MFDLFQLFRHSRLPLRPLRARSRRGPIRAGALALSSLAALAILEPAPALAQACPDPAVVSLSVISVRATDDAWRITVRATLRNVGGGEWRSRHGQQSLTLFTGARPETGTIARRDFTRLRPGAALSIAGSFTAMGGEFTPSVTARISYDPDILLDGNRRNDECSARNNRASLDAGAINAAIARAAGMPRLPSLPPGTIPVPLPYPLPWRP